MMPPGGSFSGWGRSDSFVPPGFGDAPAQPARPSDPGSPAAPSQVSFGSSFNAAPPAPPQQLKGLPDPPPPPGFPRLPDPPPPPGSSVAQPGGQFWGGTGQQASSNPGFQGSRPAVQQPVVGSQGGEPPSGGGNAPPFNGGGIPGWEQAQSSFAHSAFGQGGALPDPPAPAPAPGSSGTEAGGEIWGGIAQQQTVTAAPAPLPAAAGGEETDWIDHTLQSGPVSTPLPSFNPDVDEFVSGTVDAARALPEPPAPQMEVTYTVPVDVPMANCVGKETQWALCTHRPCAALNEKIDCVWDEWAEWTALGGCSGLGSRLRRIRTMNNEHGMPCSGPQEQTAQFNAPPFFEQSCLFGNRDCSWGAWNEWTFCGDCNACGKDRMAQSERWRLVEDEAIGDGHACQGTYNETRSCGAEESISCKLSVWAEWTMCSMPCGGGVKAHMRRVIQHAEYGGAACKGPLRESIECNEQPCTMSVDCDLSEWHEWHGCEGGSSQQNRERSILAHAQGNGKRCEDSLSQTVGCTKMGGVPWCEFTKWEEWGSCPVACGGGQQERTRHMTGDRDCIPLASADLKEVRGCNMDSCDSVSSCSLSDWDSWGGCSQNCGLGVSVRARAITQAASNGGSNCVAGLKEMKDCVVKECPVRDCLWAAWDEWSGCSCTCGGGLKRRNRVVKVTPREGGLPCAASDKSEIAPCNTEPCEECVDGLWTTWSRWSDCTSTCTPAYRWRHRSVARRNNGCGIPVAGLEEDYELCGFLPACVKDRDCGLSEWSQWNDCSCSCYGVTERHRIVTQLPMGNGKMCEEENLKEIAPCNPGADDEVHPRGCDGAGPVSCAISEWEEWGDCTASCGGGQRTRMRQILQPANHGGQPCEGELAELAPCNEKHCEGNHCVDCQWGAWSNWGDCSACKGQKYRQRTIEHLQNDCGHKCKLESAKEATNCTGECAPIVFCRWSDWADLGGCTATCGTATKLKQRRLETTNSNGTEEEWNRSVYFMAGDEDMVCSGEQTESVQCESISCEEGCYAKDCRFGQWSEWSEPSCTQLCARVRHIARRSSCGGHPCSGPQTETKRCHRDSCIKAQDCVVGNWDDWSECGRGTFGQMLRTRTILAEARNGGSACGGSLEETHPCPDFGRNVAEVNCHFSDWNSWTECTVLCAGGTKHRSRGFNPPAAGGGRPCQGSMEELTPCQEEACGTNLGQPCIFSPWEEWSHCDSHDQRERTRKVAEEPSKDGTPCKGALHEVVPCDIAVDCVLSPWTSWDQCDKSCDGGQMQRQRQVVLNPRNNGLPCPSHLVETIGCNREPCSDKDVNCKITEWAMWSTCSSTCGPGFQERKRAINKRLSHCGQGCVGNMTMVQPCFVEECGDCENCVWGLWKEWSDCDRHCGGGQRHRLRNITQWPTPGCSPCEPKDKVWVEPCNVEVCSDEELCVDGLWGNWGDWETCSMSCEGGNHWRTRNILRAATSCGNQPTGDSKEAGECNQGVPCKASQDCMWSEWVAWSDCSSSCHGIKQRTRTIETHGFGDGKYCEGPTEETFPCAFGISNDLVNFQSPALLMNLKNVVANNLGGSGPYFQDHPSIRYKGVASDGSSSIDLLITAADGYNPGQGARLNGASGEFGNIFLPRDSTANLEFQLVDSATNDPVFVNDLTLKFFDLDEGNDGSDLFTYEVSVNQKCQEYYIAHESVFKVVGTCDTPEPTIFKKPIVAELECRDGEFEFLKLDKVGHNNLGGKGPDFGEEVLLYNDVLSLDGRSVDLVIEVEDGQQYEPGHLAARVNGKIGGATRFNLAAAMGVIDQLAGTSTRFNAHFQYQNGEAATVPKLNLTWFDIDQPRANLR
ncbi:unnamed protein product, partial [Polarella glacialis]